MPAAPVLPADLVVARFRQDCVALLPARPLGSSDHAGGAPLALAVSGGPDSLALLLLAAAAFPGRIAALTVDHGLRTEARDEARFVADICGRLAVPHETLSVVVPDAAAGLQAAARDARYAAMAEWCVARGFPALATAHHLDDQAETVLMRLARGAGVAGLAGIRPVRALGPGVALVRPLLGWRRSALAAIVSASGLIPVDDPSNRDLRFDRAVVRAHLAQGWPDPARLAAIAHHAAEAEDALAYVADRLFAERFDRAAATLAAEDLPRELRRRLLLKALATLDGDSARRGDEVNRLLDRLAAGRVSTLGRWRIAPGPHWRLSIVRPPRSH